MQLEKQAGGAPSATKGASLTPSVVLALLVAQCFCGGGSVVCRAWISEGGGVSYAVYLTYRYFLGGMFLLAATKVLEGQGPSPPRLVGAGEVGALAAIMVVCSLTFLYAVGNIGSFLPAVGETLIPVYVCAVCVMCRLEPVRRAKGAGVACAVAGAVLIVAHEEARKEMSISSFLEFAEDRPHVGIFVIRHVSALWTNKPSALSIGLAMCAIHIIFAGNYWMLKKQILYRAAPMHLSAYVYLVGAAMALIVALSNRSNYSRSAWMLSEKNCYALAFATIESLTGTGLLAWATKRTKATSVCASMTLQPLFAAALSWVFVGACVHSDHMVGMLLTTVGLLLVAWSQSNEEEEGYATDMKKEAAKLMP